MRVITRALLVGLMAAVTGLAAATSASAIPPDPQPNPTGHVYNGDSPRCLDSGTTQGALLFNCSTSIYQQWTYRLRTGQFVGNSPTGCLDDGAGVNGSRVFLTACTGSLHQKWYNNGGGYGSFVNAASGRCLDADLGTIGGQATLVQVWDCNGWSNQQWYFEFTS